VNALLLGLCLSVRAQTGEAKDELVRTRQEQTFSPKQIPVTPDLLKQLKLPDGFHVAIFAHDLGKPRMLAIAPDGTVYVTRREEGDVLALRDTNADGAADEIETVTRIPKVHGITIHDNRLYLATINQVLVAPLQKRGRESFSKEKTPDPFFVGEPKVIVDGLPDAIRHPNRTLGVGPDNKLYITIGSTGNANIETDPRNAGILRCDLVGSILEIFATGLRNTLGIDWHPISHEMWGMDNGIDYLGEDQPPEELNKLEKGKIYGWPYCSGKNQPTPLDRAAPGLDLKKWLDQATPSVLEYSAHTAPLQCTFYRGAQFPKDYVGSLFVAMHGSGNRHKPEGYEIIRIAFDAHGKPLRIESFLRGFLVRPNGEWSFFGRPCGIAEAPDGSLYFSDDNNGVIYRITYSSPART
jgi:glucose/arabinose dehydrogenase